LGKVVSGSDGMSPEARIDDGYGGAESDKQNGGQYRVATDEPFTLTLPADDGPLFAQFVTPPRVTLQEFVGEEVPIFAPPALESSTNDALRFKVMKGSNATPLSTLRTPQPAEKLDALPMDDSLALATLLGESIKTPMMRDSSWQAAITLELLTVTMIAASLSVLGRDLCLEIGKLCLLNVGFHDALSARGEEVLEGVDEYGLYEQVCCSQECDDWEPDDNLQDVTFGQSDER